MEQELFDGKYRKEKRLGGGGFSDVWKVTYVKTGVTLALKIYKPGANVDSDGVDMLKHEYALMVNIAHRNLLKPQFFDICDGQPYLVLPYCERGSINNMKKKMSEEETWKLLRDMSSALEYLHTRTPAIIHQDIKPDNILIASDGSYMLTDFGVSTSLKVKATQSRLSFDDNLFGSAGTIAYMPPNKFSRKNLPIFANDIWSLGATVFEMLTGELPFGQTGGLIQKKGAEVPDLPEDFSNLLNDTIRSCMDEDPAKRPFASKLYEISCDALKHPEKLIPMNQAPVAEPVAVIRPVDEMISDDKKGTSESAKAEGTTHYSSEPSSLPAQSAGNPSTDTNETEKEKEKEKEKTIPKWLIVLGIAAGMISGVLLALFL